MKNKFFIIFTVCLLLTGFTTAQENLNKTIQFHYKYGKIIDEEPPEPSAFLQAKKVERPRIYLLSCFASGGNGEETFSNCIDLSEVSSIYLYTEVFALLKTNVRFHIAFIGPETIILSSEEFFEWKKNECSFFVAEIVPEEWEPGVYTIVWIAEIKEAGGGVGLKKQCVVKFYKK